MLVVSVSQVLDFVSASEHCAKPLVIHGFSVGGYLCGETVLKVHERPQDYGQVGERLQGQVLDSPADLDKIPFGFSKAVSSVPIVQTIVEKMLQAHLSTFKNTVTRHYRKSSNTMRENQLRTPTLFLYSDVDPVGMAGPIEEVMANYTSRNIPVFAKKFSGSAHVSHYHRYPAEYTEQLDMFLKHLGLFDSDGDEVSEKLQLRN